MRKGWGTRTQGGSRGGVVKEGQALQGGKGPEGRISLQMPVGTPQAEEQRRDSQGNDNSI